MHGLIGQTSNTLSKKNVRLKSVALRLAQVKLSVLAGFIALRTTDKLGKIQQVISIQNKQHKIMKSDIRAQGNNSFILIFTESFPKLQLISGSYL